MVPESVLLFCLLIVTEGSEWKPPSLEYLRLQSAIVFMMSIKAEPNLTSFYTKIFLNKSLTPYDIKTFPILRIL